MADAPKKCFVISPIGEAGGPVRKHADMTLNAIIKPALAECGIPLDVKRGDEDSQIGMITDHLIADILEADLIVADLSFLNANVFYELGIAHAVEKPVLHLAHKETKLPFDNVGYRAIMFDPTDWHSQVEARKQIASSAQLALSKHGAVSNPITHARGWDKLRKSSDSEKSIIAKLIAENADIKQKINVLLEHNTKSAASNSIKKDADLHERLNKYINMTFDLDKMSNENGDSKFIFKIPTDPKVL